MSGTSYVSVPNASANVLFDDTNVMLAPNVAYRGLAVEFFMYYEVA